MKTRKEKFEEYPIFNQMEGLAEEIVRFEAKTGVSLPDIFSYTFMEGLMTDEEAMVMGKMGPFYIVAHEKGGTTHYELHENKASFRLWASELFHDLKTKREEAVLTQEQQQLLAHHHQLFFEKIEKLCEEA